ncbi:MAG: hypothetical protein ACRD0Z_03240 [Acidimicrobiales bacterium]
MALVTVLLITDFGFPARVASAAPLLHLQTRVAALAEPVGQIVGPHPSTLVVGSRRRVLSHDLTTSGSCLAASEPGRASYGYDLASKSVFARCEESSGVTALAAAAKFGGQDQSGLLFANDVSLRLAAEGGGGDSYLFRGVASDHPAYPDALNGDAFPRGGDANALEHNLGDTNSSFTSWTTDANIAKEFAGSDGAILRIPNAAGSGYSLLTSPDLFGESEVLVQGNVINAQRFFSAWEGLER